MAPRKRKRQNEDLPSNLYTNIAKGVTYYYWQHPLMLTKEQLGPDRQAAIVTARALNKAIANMGIDPEARAQRPKGMRVAELVKEFKPVALSRLGSDNSKKATGNYLERIAEAIGHIVVTSVTVRDLSSAFSDAPATTYIKIRSTLVALFDFALSRGHIPHHMGNPASVLERKSEPKVQRQRLTEADYYTILNHEDTPEYLRISMMLMMQMTTRPIDVVNLKFSQYRDGVLWTKIRKTKKIQGLKLRPQAEAVLHRARQSGIASPYIVHALPGRHVAKEHRSAHRDHPTQLTTDKLSRTFSEIRDTLGIGAGKNGTPPTLYEVRSLAVRKYKAQGENRKNLIALLAHTDDDTIEIYEDERDIESAIIVAEAGIDA